MDPIDLFVVFSIPDINPVLLLLIQFTCRLHDAFVQNNLSMAIMILIEEKSSVSLADRLDEVIIKAGYEFAFSVFSCNINGPFFVGL